MFDTDDFLRYMVNQVGICLETEGCIDFFAEKLEDSMTTVKRIVVVIFILKNVYILLVF
jgi:hypothetical protein